jgi:hypothetical protein
MSLPRITKGTVRVLYAYDIGLSIQLGSCGKHVQGLTADERIKHKGHAPEFFQFDPQPLRVVQDIEPVRIAPGIAASSAEITLFDFGGVSVHYVMPFQGTFEELIELSIALAGSSVFRDDSRRRVENLLELVREYVTKPGVADLFDDYLVFQIESFEQPVPLLDLHTVHGPSVARLLRSEHDSLSDQEIQEALAGRVSFGVHDVALIDWNAALLVDREPDDVLAVLEFVNLQLLETRFLDAQLDNALDRSYEILGEPRTWRRIRLPGTTRVELHRVAQMKVDGAILFERVNNALKLLGDQYLSRVYRQVSQRYRMNEWNSGILRKLDTIESIYEKVHDSSVNFRMEALEWIVIFLIALEIVIAVVGRH